MMLLVFRFSIGLRGLGLVRVDLGLRRSEGDSERLGLGEKAKADRSNFCETLEGVVEFAAFGTLSVTSSSMYGDLEVRSGVMLTDNKRSE